MNITKRPSAGLPLYSVLGVAIAVMVSLLVFSCATARKYDPGAPKVAIARASDAEIAKYGPNFLVNPFKEPSIIILGKTYDFYIVKISLNLDKQTKIKVIASSQGPSGADIPAAYTQAEFVHFWDVVSNEGGPNVGEYERRKTTIERTVIPELSFSEGSGQNSYFLVFVGKHPVKRPITYEVQVILDSGEAFVFSETLE